jgi:Fe-S-cluster containining protein
MERRFHCTACGKCCFGLLPLTLQDAIAHAGRFPLAMIWTTVRQGAKSYDLSARLGATFKVGKRKTVAVQVVPTAYIPPSLPCPELMPDGLCAIHAEKPSRCRTMPFFPYREESDQTELLVPRTGWLCDTSESAPVVYRDKKIVDRQDFDRERADLLEQAPILRAYAERLMKTAPNVTAALEQAAKKPMGGRVVLNFTAILSRVPGMDVADFARRQLPVLRDFAELTADTPADSEYHRHYRDCAAGMERFLQTS